MTISFYNIKDIFYQFSNKEKFSRTTRKLIGFINIESINKYISEIQAVRKYLIKGRESPEMEDRVIPSEIILESGAWKTISTSPNKYQYALSVEDLNEQKIYRLEGKVVTDLYTDIKNPIPLQD
jgi:hypothetical protein